MPQKSCGVVVWTGSQKEPRYLLLRQSLHGHWEFPKGHVETGESEVETARRELVEETGLDDVIFNEVYRTEIYYTVAVSKGRDDKTVVYFLAQSASDQIQLSREHTEGSWFSYPDAIRKLSFENYKNVLRSASKQLRSA